MKEKTINTIKLLGVMLCLLLIVCLGMALLFPNNTASAMSYTQVSIVDGGGGGGGSTSTARPVAFDYDMLEYTRVFCMTEWLSFTIPSGSGTGVTEFTANSSEVSSFQFKIYLKDGTSDTSTFTGGYIRSTSVTISANNNYTYKGIILKNAADVTVKSTSTNTLTVSDLIDGETYSCTVYGHDPDFESEYCDGHAMCTTATFSFTVDSKAPTITNASTSTTGKISTSDFLVTASDDGTGLEGLYVKIPGSTIYSKCAGNSYAVNGSSGTYTFYAKDNSGLVSSTYYAILDKEKPVGKVVNSNSVDVTNYCTNKMFKYSATDVGSGIDHLEYFPPTGNWTTYTAGTLVGGTNGTYCFRAVDKAGLVSDVVTVFCDIKAPIVKISVDGNAMSNGSSVKGSTLSIYAEDGHSGVSKINLKKPGASGFEVVANNSSYTTDGKYELYCVDIAGNSSATVTVTKDSTAPVLLADNAVFGGYADTTFTVNATDELSSCTLYYKKPRESTFTACGTSKTVNVTDTGGLYMFYAKDSLGNTSETKSIELNVVYPQINVVSNTTANTVTVTWTGSDYNVKLNGKSYTKNTTISAEGDYTVVATDSRGLSTTKNFSIGHKYERTAMVASTCTEQGYSTYKCVSCGDSYDADYLNALGHSYMNTVVNPTCTTGGQTVHTCTRCSNTYSDATTAALGHNLTGWFVMENATCTAKGTQQRNCTRCSYSETKATDMVAHSSSEWLTDVAATCTLTGTKHKECTVCKQTLQTGSIAALGHNYLNSVVSPTCLETGYTVHSCTRCSYEYTDSATAALGHSMSSWYSVVEPSCTANGSEQRNCVRCSQTEVRATVALGHNYAITNVPATCTEGGYAHYVCARCNNSYDEVKSSAVGHSYVEMAVDPTCTEGGGIKHTCSECGFEYISEKEYALGHLYTNTVSLSASCTTCGNRHSHCERCGDEYDTEIPACGHLYEITDEENNNGSITRTYVCSVCGDSYEQDLGNQYERVTTYVEYLFEQYVPYMGWVLLATAGIWSVVMGVFLILAHKQEDKIKAKRMVINYVIGLVAIFFIVVACPYLVNGIAVLVS